MPSAAGREILRTEMRRGWCQALLEARRQRADRRYRSESASATRAIAADSERPASVLSSPEAPNAVLGREAEFATLREWVEGGLAGDRQVVFVTGEPGIGKTSLVNGLLQQVSAVARVWIARGQCLEQFGAGEAYLPVLEGLSRLGRAPGGDRIIELFASARSSMAPRIAVVRGTRRSTTAGGGRHARADAARDCRRHRGDDGGTALDPGGENIYPREIEEFLYQHAKVKDVQCIGVPDAKYGEQLCACIILREGEQATEQDIRDFCTGRIGRYKIPRYVRFMSSFPMTVLARLPNTCCASRSPASWA
jgi:hypothetical protein